MGGKINTIGGFGKMNYPAPKSPDAPTGFVDPNKLPVQHPASKSETMPGQAPIGAPVK